MSFTRTAFAGEIFCGVMLLLGLSAAITGQSDRCSDSDLRAVLQPTDDAYTRAMELVNTLQAEELIIRCVLRSKMDGRFEGQIGAALFRTNRGDFDAMFLPKDKTFEKLNIRERQRQDNGWYLYSFEGEPTPITNGIESPRPIYYVKHADLLLETWNDQLAEALRRAVSK